MRAHAEKSQRIMLAAGLEDGEIIGSAVRHHHERYDGRGYPDGLAGEAIPILARIIAIADAYDAMASVRSFGDVMTHSHVMEELTREQGQQHDPWLCRRFVTVIEASEFRA
jgi:HD-GYP domain-containing protein (c-di-GMP phosphodiesterase class II)